MHNLKLNYCLHPNTVSTISENSPLLLTVPVSPLHPQIAGVVIYKSPHLEN